MDSIPFESVQSVHVQMRLIPIITISTLVLHVFGGN